MPHLYTCHQCRTEAPARRDRYEDAEADQEAHRDAAHGGHRPMDGDEIRHVHAAGRGDGLLPSGSCLAVLILLALVLANCWGR